MIEQGIYFALGCIVTALLALLFAPAFWQRALRLTRQRLQLQVPLSMQEILAERDQLRAAFAVERLRVEQDMARVQSGKDHDMAELGRRSMEVVALTERTAAQQKDVDRLERAVTEAEAELGTLRVTMHEGQADVDLWRNRAEGARGRQETLEAEADTLRATIASLKTRSMGLEMRLSDSERGQMAREREADAGLRTRLETAMEHAARHESAGLSLRRELDEAKLKIHQLEGELALTGKRSAGPASAAPSQAVPPGDETGLRESIHALGVAVAKLSRPGERDATPSGDQERRPSRDFPRPVGVA